MDAAEQNEETNDLIKADSLKPSENLEINFEKNCNSIYDEDSSPKTLQEKLNPSLNNQPKEIVNRFLNERNNQRNSLSNKPMHRKNYSMMNEKLNNDVDLDWRIKERSMSQTVDLQENKSILLNNIKYSIKNYKIKSKIHLNIIY